jgi:hypothetical protein
MDSLTLYYQISDENVLRLFTGEAYNVLGNLFQGNIFNKFEEKIIFYFCKLSNSHLVKGKYLYEVSPSEGRRIGKVLK